MTTKLKQMMNVTHVIFSHLILIYCQVQKVNLQGFEPAFQHCLSTIFVTANSNKPLL